MAWDREGVGTDFEGGLPNTDSGEIEAQGQVRWIDNREQGARAGDLDLDELRMRSRQDKAGRQVAVTHGDLESFERAVLAGIDKDPQTDGEGERDHPQAHIAFEPASDATDQRAARLRPRRIATLVERSQRS